MTSILGRADRALDRIGAFSVDQTHEYLFVRTGNEEMSNTLEQLTRCQYADLKIIKVSQEVLCVYKHEVSNPEAFFTSLWLNQASA